MLEIAKSSWGMMDTISRLGNALRDRYDIERELGHGGMATVFLARDLRHERPVAIKVLHPELAAAVGAERFLREIRIAAQLQHPHILTLIDSGDAEGLLFYVMPYVEGVSLRDRVAAGTRVTVSETIRLMRDVVDALAYAHRQGVVHRDIKPDNVMVCHVDTCPHQHWHLAGNTGLHGAGAGCSRPCGRSSGRHLFRGRDAVRAAHWPYPVQRIATAGARSPHQRRARPRTGSQSRGPTCCCGHRHEVPGEGSRRAFPERR
jgi:serine/threonine protein kinase